VIIFVKAFLFPLHFKPIVYSYILSLPIRKPNLPKHAQSRFLTYRRPGEACFTLQRDTATSTMSSNTLPTIPQIDVASHNTAKSCYVTVGSKVYDLTSFIDDHPGGGQLILEYGGKDVKVIMEEELSHTHSDSAYEILNDHLVGLVATDPVIDGITRTERPDGVILPSSESMKELEDKWTVDENAEKTVYATTGMSSAADLSKETDTTNDYRTHKFLDLNRPLFMQIWNGGFSREFYLEQVHRPRHYKGGESAPLFGNFLEPLSKTAWWVVPTVWLPPVMYGTLLAGQGLPTIFQLVTYWILGLCIWTLVEYGLHRCLFHIDK